MRAGSLLAPDRGGHHPVRGAQGGGGLPPYAAYVARTIFMHTLAFNEPLKGLSPEQLRYSMLGPA